MATYAEREQARRERALRRAERREEWAARREEKATSAVERSHEITDHIPLGQPVLAGHHSQRRHERDLRRIRSLSDRAAEDTGMAEHHARRAGGIRSREEQRASGPTTERRIATLEAELRHVARTREGRLDWTPDGTPFMRTPDSTAAAALDAREAEITEQLAYWRAHLAQLTESGAHRVWTRADFAVGDAVQVRGRWYRDDYDCDCARQAAAARGRARRHRPLGGVYVTRDTGDDEHVITGHTFRATEDD